MNPYKQAIANHNAAIAEFKKVQEQYRAQKVGDTVYLAARAKRGEADKAFDAAFEREASYLYGDKLR